MCLCLSLAAFPYYCTNLRVTWGNGRGCPLVVHCWVDLLVHCWADLQSVHGFCCYDNIAPDVCVSVHRCIPLLLHRFVCNLRGMVGMPLIVHCWADLQLVHGFHCYDNTHVCKLIALYTAECEMSASACTRSVACL